jgi:hypothetical protein
VSGLRINGVAYIVLLGSRCEAKVIRCSVVMLLAVLRIGSVEPSCHADDNLLLPLLLETYDIESLAIESLGAFALKNSD